MKKHLTTMFAILRGTMLAVMTGVIAFSPSAALAATNTASWDIGGVGQANATFNLVSFNAGNIDLTKTAFLASDGSELADGATVPAGTQVDFMIFINNKTGVAINNINIADVLNPAEFAYVATNLQVGSTGECAALACNAAERTALYGAVAAVASEAVEGGDVAGWTGGTNTVSAGSSAGNAQLNVPSATAWALVFRATVQ